MADVKRQYMKVRGTVQGVGFRQFAQEQAARLGLVGYVRNLPGGDVEIQAEGPPSQVDDLVQAVSRGPAAAEVSDVETKDVDAKGTESRFSIAPTM